MSDYVEPDIAYKPRVLLLEQALRAIDEHVTSLHHTQTPSGAIIHGIVKAVLPDLR